MRNILLTLITFMIMINLLQFAVIDYNLDNTSEMSQSVEGKKQIIKVSFSAIKEDYIKIVTLPTVAENMATMFVSKKTEDPNVNNFSYLAREKNINTIYVPRPYLKNGDKDQLFFHIGIECIDKCDYKIMITFENAITMSHDSKYLFLTDESATTLTMRVNRLKEDKAIMIYALGGYTAEIEKFELKYKNPLSVEGPIDIPSSSLFYNGVAAVFNEAGHFTYEEGAYYELTLQTIPKSYIALGVRNISKASDIISYEVIYGLIDTQENKKECFKMNEGMPGPGIDHTFTLNVETFTQNAFVYLTPNEDEDPTNPNLKWEFNTASFVIINKQDLLANFICVKASESSTNQFVSFSLHLVDNIDSYNNQSRNLPRVNGLISTHHLEVSKITFYRYYKRTNEKRTVSMTMKVIKGNPIAYAHVNYNYPDFRYSDQTLQNLDQDGKLIKSHKLNDFFSLNIEDLGEDSLVSTKQNVLLIQCLPNKPSDEDCIFQLAFTDAKDSIMLKPNENFATFVHKGVEDHYSFTINRSNPVVEKFIINLYSFSGDSGLSISLPEGVQSEKTFVGNKQIITVTGDAFELVNSYQVDVIGYTNGYYSISYMPIYSSSMKLVTVESGSALLETITGEKGQMQAYRMKNKRSKQQGSFVTTFFPLNCRISVKYTGITPVEIEGIDDLFQHELKSGIKDYTEDFYPYEVSVLEAETLVDYCMVYISGNEIISDDIGITRELVLNEASNYQIILNEETKKMSYIYPHPGIDGEVIGSFSMDEGVAIQVTIKVESTLFSTILMKRSRNIIVEKDQLELGCKTKEFLCNVIFEVAVVNPEALTKKQKFDIQIRSDSKTPGYLKKNYMVEDIMEANIIQYYFTDIEHNEEGELSLNFKRGSGKMLARLIPKEVIEENPDWNGKVKLPTEQATDLLAYNDFLKKIVITNEQTNNCAKGCDLYIGIKAEDEFEEGFTYFTDYTIFYQKKNSPVKIDLNEFINGRILKLKQKDVYQITIPYDTQTLRIDFQSEICSLYGFRGLPDKDKKPDWTFEGKKNGVFLIKDGFKKNEIITFHVTTEFFDAIYSATYLVKFDLPVTDRTDLILINSDQNSLCQTEIDDSYCYFLLPINFFDKSTQLSIYGYTEDFTSITIYANYDQMADFDKKSKEEIEALLPKKNSAKYTSEGSLQTDVLTIEDAIISLDTYVIIGVHLPLKTILTLVTTFRSHLTTMVLNPVSMQLIVMKKDKSLDLKLPDSNNYLVYIAGLVGRGSVEFVNSGNANKYKIADKRNLALVVDKDDKAIKVTSGEKFIFDVYYVIRPEENFDEIENASTNEILYKKKDLPLIFYSKVYDENEDIIINININSVIKAGDKKDEFDILGIITNEEIINKKKRDKDINPLFSKPVIGKYDSSINAGKIYFKSSYIKEYQSVSKKYLYVTFNKKLSNTNVYSEVHATITSTPSGNHDFPIVANTYFHYTLIKDQVKASVFQLIKNAKSEKYLKFEFSSNSDFVNFAYLNIDQASPESVYTNSTDIIIESQENTYGKRTIVFNLAATKGVPDKILIAVFYNTADHKVESEYLSNYVIRYSTSDEKQATISLKNKGKVDHTYSGQTLTLKFGKVIDQNNKIVDAKYSIRYIPNSEFRNSELYNSITILDAKNPIIVDVQPKEGEMIEYSYPDFPFDRSYIVTVVATTLQGEMLLYNHVKDPTGKDASNSEGKFPLWLIILISIISVLVLAGVIGIFFYVKKLSNKFGRPEQELGKVDEGNIGLVTSDTY